MKVKDTGGGDFESPDPGSYSAICTKVIDQGTQPNDFDPEAKHAHKIVIGWELEEKMSDGRPFGAVKTYTASLHDKATLRAHLEAWRGVKFTADELSGFDLKNILGKPCMLSLVQNENGRIKVQSVSKLPKGMASPQPINQLVYFSLEEFNQAVFDKLSDKIKKKIMRSPEYQSRSSDGPVIGTEASKEEVPF